MANIIKVTYISYTASNGEYKQKIEYYPTDKDLAYYDGRLSSREPELWEIVDDKELDPKGVFILVPNEATHEGEQLLRNYLTNKFKGWDLGFTNNG